MSKRDYLYKGINALVYGVAIFIYIMLFIYVNNQWEAIPEEIKYTWGIPEVEDFIANKWGIFIIAGIMILDVKRIAKKQRKEEKKTKEVNARVRWKRLTTAIKTLAVSIIWGMVIVYIVQNAMGKQIENGINYIAVTFLIILAISFVDKIIASLLKNRRKIKA